MGMTAAGLAPGTYDPTTDTWAVEDATTTTTPKDNITFGTTGILLKNDAGLLKILDSATGLVQKLNLDNVADGSTRYAVTVSGTLTYVSEIGGARTTHYGSLAGQNNPGADNALFGYAAYNTGVANFVSAFGSEAVQNSSDGTGKMCGFGWRAIRNSGARSIGVGYNAGGPESGADTLVIDNSEASEYLIFGKMDTQELKIGGSLGVRSKIGSEGGYNLYQSEVTVDLSASSTIQANIPDKSKIVGWQWRNDTAIGVTTATSYTLTFSGGASDVLASLQGLTQNVKGEDVGTIETTGETDIEVTPNGGGTLDSGTIRVIVYYWGLEALPNL